jgi:hypothetical protein
VVLLGQHAHFQNVLFEDTCLLVQSNASASLADCQFTMSEGISTGVSLLLSDSTVHACNCSIHGDHQAVYIAGSKASLHAEKLSCTGNHRGIMLCDRAKLVLRSSALHGRAGEGSIGLVALNGTFCSVHDSAISGYDLGLMASQCKVEMETSSLGTQLQSCLLNDCSAATFERCVFSGSKSGLVVAGSSTGACDLRTCSFINKGETAVVVQEGAQINLTSCRIECSYCCIFVHLGSRATVSKCTVKNVPSIAEDELERCALVRVRTGGHVTFQDTKIEARHHQPGLAVADYGSEVYAARCHVTSAGGCAVAAKDHASCTLLDSTLQGDVGCLVIDSGSVMCVHDSYLDGKDIGASADDGGRLSLHGCRVVCPQRGIELKGASEVNGQGCIAVVTGGTIEGAKVAVAVQDGAVMECCAVRTVGNDVSFNCGPRSVLMLSACVSDDAVPYEVADGGELVVSECMPDDEQFCRLLG